jgi:hypothetical protein
LIQRLVQNIDLPLLLLSPAVSAVGLVYSEPPFSAVLLYAGILGFGIALVLNHRKHKHAEK